MKSVEIGKSKLNLKKGDITQENVDAIVNAANPSLMGGGGVDGAIHRAGGPAILEECRKIAAEIGGRLPRGNAVITTGGKLPAKYVIHTAGPIWGGGDKGEPETLRRCYINSLKLALEKGLKTVSFPSISTGVYGYPVDEAAKVALEAVISFLRENEGIEEINFVLFDERTYETYEKALTDLGY
jgi:O-acetyl-ADP-ribose deacetylase (regulator of RNase III)